MVIKTVEIGDQEKHTITAEYSEKSGKSRILIDQDQVWSGSLQFRKSFNYSVGQKEKHSIRIRMGGIILDSSAPPDVEILVDETQEQILQLKRKDRKKILVLVLIFVLILIFGFFIAWLQLSH
jgi:predicted nucleic acid-binding Zn ribbon protein